MATSSGRPCRRARAANSAGQAPMWPTGLRRSWSKTTSGRRSCARHRPKQLPTRTERAAVHFVVRIVIGQRGGADAESVADHGDGLLRLSKADPIWAAVSGAGRKLRVERVEIEVQTDFAHAVG